MYLDEPIELEVTEQLSVCINYGNSIKLNHKNPNENIAIFVNADDIKFLIDALVQTREILNK